MPSKRIILAILLTSITAIAQNCGCGGGFIGNKKCSDGRCCSKYGYCGSSPIYCDAINCVGGCPLQTRRMRTITRTVTITPMLVTTRTPVQTSEITTRGSSTTQPPSLTPSSPSLTPSPLSSTPSSPPSTPPTPSATITTSITRNPSTTATATSAPPVSTPAGLGTGRVLYADSGFGSYYYDANNQSCPNEAIYPENRGYAACESYTPGPNQKMLFERKTNLIVAMNDRLLSNNRSAFCGKRAKVYYRGILRPEIFYVWDACGACGFEAQKRLDFSRGALNTINPNTCQLGIVPDIRWEIVDEQIAPFIA